MPKKLVKNKRYINIRVSLAQINPTVGDLSGNALKILSFCNLAKKENSNLVLFPEMALTGYPAEDILFHKNFIQETKKQLHRIQKTMPPSLVAVVGSIEGTPQKLFNTAAVLKKGKIIGRYAKQILPNYSVFDEKRYFHPGNKNPLFNINGIQMGITICEDVWIPKGPMFYQAKKGAQMIINISSSPFHAGKLQERLKILRQRVRENKVPIAYCNLVGGQDELIFDGASSIISAEGNIIEQTPQFQEVLKTTEISFPQTKKIPPKKIHPLSPQQEIYSALVLGTRDYIKKNRFKKAVIGLSGGIDSSLVACVAVDAIGKDNIVGITMPSQFNSDATKNDAQRLAKNLGIEFKTIPIETITQAFLKSLKPLFNDRAPDLTEENIQARVRGTLLMALSNKFGWLVLTTGNKSETSVGYSTLYGDTAGGFSVIKDIPKTMVYKLCEERNRVAKTDLIPKSVITRPPSAELRPDQKDQDSLPPYELLDKIIRLYVEENESPQKIIKKHTNPSITKKMVRLIDMNEYKRRQNPPGIKITPRAFGKDRRMPITNRFIDK